MIDDFSRRHDFVASASKWMARLSMYLWRKSGRPRKALLWQIRAVIANTNIQCGIIQYFVPRNTANYRLSYTYSISATSN